MILGHTCTSDQISFCGLLTSAGCFFGSDPLHWFPNSASPSPALLLQACVHAPERKASAIDTSGARSSRVLVDLNKSGMHFRMWTHSRASLRNKDVYQNTYVPRVI